MPKAPVPKTNWFVIIRQLYLYGVSGVALVMMVVASIGLVNLAIEEYVLDVKDWGEISKDYWECDEENVSSQQYESFEECKQSVDEQRATEADNDKKRALAEYISMLIVAVPLYIFHWKIIRKEKKN